MFQPVVPFPGLTGWRFLQDTYSAQIETFTKTGLVQRDAEYFVENIGKVTTAEDLVKDRRLLSVALGAFGLQDDINNRFFIQKVLEEGVTAEDALANRLADTRYRNLSAAFGLGPGEVSQVGLSDFASGLVEKFEANAFEVAAGAQNDSMRVALYAQRMVAEVAGQGNSNNARWFTILGDPPLRQVFERALNLPTEIGQIDIDQQLEVFKEKAREIFGSDEVDQFLDAELREDLITRYVVREQIAQSAVVASGASVALSLLRGGG